MNEYIHTPIIKYVKGRRTGLVTFCVETAFLQRVIEGKIGGDRSDRKTRKKT
jgi:hypothetical protein